MPKGAKRKSKGLGKRNVGGGNNKSKANKRAARTGFQTRHIDQVWEDVRKQVNVVTKPDGTRLGPVGTTDRTALDADLPAQGIHTCIACNRYFISPMVLAEHERSKPHKRRVKALRGPKPHNQRDADLAGDMGKPDNGPKLRSTLPASDMNAVMQGIQRM